MVITYGTNRRLNIYNQDRKAAVKSFICYWQINFMIRMRSYGQFPLVEGIKKVVGYKNSHEVDEKLGGQNLKKQFKLPQLFSTPVA